MPRSGVIFCNRGATARGIAPWAVPVASPKMAYLIPLDVVLAHDRAPDPHLLAHELAQVLRSRQRKRDLLRLGELPGDAGLAQAGRELRAEPVVDCFVLAAPADPPPPRIGLEPKKAAFTDVRRLGERSLAGLPRLYARPNSASRDGRNRHRRAGAVR